jgi:hypothetical protein
MISKLGCNFIAINNAATCYGDVHNKLFISFDKALNNNLPSGITLSGLHPSFDIILATK